jgi:hypothetical protein
MRAGAIVAIKNPRCVKAVDGAPAVCAFNIDNIVRHVHHVIYTAAAM